MAQAAVARLGLLGPAVQEERVRKIAQRVASGSRCTIRDLAVECNLSPSHLQHLFKQQTGVGLGHWLTEQRLERAAHLLVHSTMSVKEIGYAVGYEHPSSFIRAFGRHFRQAPRCYRQQGDRTKC